jgi:outer membrane protein OmpA-like peptidoglycan-associated protein
MKKHVTMMAVALAVPVFTSACATKGFVREQLAAQRTAIDSVIAMERTERMAGDSALRGEFTTQLNALRADLTSLRDTFNVRITALENGVQFATPVNFAFDDATVRDQDRELLDRFATVVQKYYPGSKITVEGFADPVGGANYNRRLSMRRAESVKAYLTEKGITSEIQTIGYGEARPVVPGAGRDEPGAEQNRRVVFVIESRPQQTRGVAAVGSSQ